jgi:ribosome maturation factor RimP
LIQKKKNIKNNPSTNQENSLFPVHEKDVISQVWRLVEPVCEYKGMELVHVEYQHEPHGRILRIYIDRINGVTLDDCVDISRMVGDLLDMELEPIGPYHLEVSSPGLNRPLSKKTDFEKYRGKKAMLKTHQPLNGQKKFKGVLSGISEENVMLLIDEKMVGIPFNDIHKAQLIDNNGE